MFRSLGSSPSHNKHSSVRVRPDLSIGRSVYCIMRFVSHELFQPMFYRLELFQSERRLFLVVRKVGLIDQPAP